MTLIVLNTGMCRRHSALQLRIDLKYANDCLPAQTPAKDGFWTAHATRTIQ